MEKGLLHLHSGLRYVILILIIAVIILLINKYKKVKTISLPLLICSHIMLLIGIYQLFWGRYGWVTAKIPEGVKIMKDKFFRFFMVEHPLMMIIATLLITIGHSSVKVQNWNKARNLYILALILILAAIPWPFREALGRGWMPQ